MTGSQKQEEGTLYWVTGLAGAGKTTIGKLLFAHLRNAGRMAVLLDGDTMRPAFCEDLGYSQADRFRCAMRYARTCRLLTKQGIDVVCTTISMSEKVRQWNRQENPAYCEIYLKVPWEILAARNQKGMYAQEKDRNHLVGGGVAMEEPQNPDFILENDGKESPEILAERLWQKIKQGNWLVAKS